MFSNKDRPGYYHTRWRKSDRESHYDIIYMWNLKRWSKWTYLQSRNRLRDIETKLWLPKGQGEGIILGVWDEKIHTTIHKIDNQQGPTVSTESYTRYLIIIRRECKERQCILIYV